MLLPYSHDCHAHLSRRTASGQGQLVSTCDAAKIYKLRVERPGAVDLLLLPSPALCGVRGAPCGVPYNEGI